MGSHRRAKLPSPGGLPLPFTWLGFLRLFIRTSLGLPLILLAKLIARKAGCFIALGIHSIMGLKLHSSKYVPALHSVKLQQFSDDNQLNSEEIFSKLHNGQVTVTEIEFRRLSDVDVWIRLEEYAVLCWAVVDLAPNLFQVIGF